MSEEGAEGAEKEGSGAVASSRTIFGGAMAGCLYNEWRLLGVCQVQEHCGALCDDVKH